MFGRLTLIFATVMTGAPAIAVQVTREVEVDAPAAEVWQVAGPFCAISDWYPGLDTCNEETIDGVRHREIITSDGGRFLERYVEAGSETAYGYAIIESPLPVKDYEATFEVKGMGETSMVVWSSTFAADGARDDEAAEMLGGIYQTGLDALKQRFTD